LAHGGIQTQHPNKKITVVLVSTNFQFRRISNLDTILIMVHKRNTAASEAPFISPVSKLRDELSCFSKLVFGWLTHFPGSIISEDFILMCPF